MQALKNQSSEISPLIEDWVAFLGGEEILTGLNTFDCPVFALVNNEFDGFSF